MNQGNSWRGENKGRLWKKGGGYLDMLLSKYVISAFGLLTKKAGLTSIVLAYWIQCQNVSLKSLFSSIKTRTMNLTACIGWPGMELARARPGQRPREVEGFQRFCTSSGRKQLSESRESSKRQPLAGLCTCDTDTGPSLSQRQRCRSEKLDFTYTRKVGEREEWGHLTQGWPGEDSKQLERPMHWRKVKDWELGQKDYRRRKRNRVAIWAK